MSAPHLAIVGFLLVAGAVAAQWLGFLYSRTAGELSLLALPVVAWVLSWFIGTRAPGNRLLVAFVAAGLGALLCYVNYAFLYWLRVMHLREIDAGLFQYFGSVYGGGIWITALVCGALAPAGASLSRKPK
jgi:hypothetical protein